MKVYSFSLWLRLTISAAIGALFYHLSLYRMKGFKKEKAQIKAKKTKDKAKRLFNFGHTDKDNNKSVVYTLSKNARR